MRNRSRSFQNTCIAETGLSGFHRMTISVTKRHFINPPPKIIRYRDYKKFGNNDFFKELQSVYYYHGNENLKPTLMYFSKFAKMFLISMHLAKRNSKPFMTNILRKKIYFAILNENRITDSKRFGKQLDLFFLINLSIKNHLKITLAELVSQDKKVADPFNNFSSNIVKNLNIPEHKSGKTFYNLTF